jgi:two-component system, chemotaxis family, response regulator Rcp1
MKNVLLIEDSAGEARIMLEAFKTTGTGTSLHWVRNGTDAIAFLKKSNDFGDKPTPDLILLDLNMPGVDGRELLKLIKGDESLNFIPVLVLSNSTFPTDIAYCYKLNANCYLSKPSGFEKTVRMVELIHEFWLGIVQAHKVSAL